MLLGKKSRKCSLSHSAELIVFIIRVRAKEEIKMNRFLTAARNNDVATVQKSIAPIMYMVTFALVVVQTLVPETAFASLPWDEPLESLKTAITGTTAKVICTIVVCCSGLMIAMGEGGSAGRTMLKLVFGLALAFGFAQIIALFE